MTDAERVELAIRRTVGKLVNDKATNMPIGLAALLMVAEEIAKLSKQKSAELAE